MTQDPWIVQYGGLIIGPSVAIFLGIANYYYYRMNKTSRLVDYVFLTPGQKLVRMKARNLSLFGVPAGTMFTRIVFMNTGKEAIESSDYYRPISIRSGNLAPIKWDIFRQAGAELVCHEDFNVQDDDSGRPALIARPTLNRNDQFELIIFYPPNATDVEVHTNIKNQDRPARNIWTTAQQVRWAALRSGGLVFAGWATLGNAAIYFTGGSIEAQLKMTATAFALCAFWSLLLSWIFITEVGYAPHRRMRRWK